MKTLVDNKYRIVSILQANGFSKEDAQIVTQALTSVDVSELSSKKDLKDLELRMVKWGVGIQVAQTGVSAAFVLGVLQLYFG